ncbi:hydrogenase maturation nickel metallochaperone HypA [Streptomyces xantholiticus]|uniref:hydrogenase maturation nickel metallochaperone HypA n=1 Tax=Streptomyces xantholiticus TaxID=68285 RepID=UPI001673062A|nr:hydrogenase maturation nickel metallochaperone HypA [Streptomyces xantholiticus]GGW49939.1 putative hydrogenase nickel incorporation protein HypA [Streptomyces xantholiticus]
MHEMSVALAVVDQVEQAARSRGAVGVESVSLDVGELAGVVPDALAFCFELACAGTVLEGAELFTRSVPGTARCGTCADVWDVGMPPQLICPACGNAAADLVSGRELRISEVRWADVEAEADAAHVRIREPIPQES